MTNVRRPKDLFFRVVEVPYLVLAELTTKMPALHSRQQMIAFSPACGVEKTISAEELRVLTNTPFESWTAAKRLARKTGVHEDVVASLVDRGLLWEEDSGRRSTDNAEERYRNTYWSPHAAYYHFNSKWHDIDASDPSLPRAIAEHPEPAPDPFFDAPGASARVPLPALVHGPLSSLLRARQTCRAFEPSAELRASDLSGLLFQTFGCRGVVRRSQYPSIRKHSPSGGSLHPTEGYVLIRSAEGFAPGIYHYNVRAHALDLLRETRAEEARGLALLFVAYQDWFADAQVLFIHVARILRHTWKYRTHPKSYRVLLMDVGHLSQTFYLACAELGLGAFFTGAINDRNIEEELGLDPLEFCVLGINGCGIPAARDPHAGAVDPHIFPEDAPG